MFFEGLFSHQKKMCFITDGNYTTFSLHNLSGKITNVRNRIYLYKKKLKLKGFSLCTYTHFTIHYNSVNFFFKAQ